MKINTPKPYQVLNCVQIYTLSHSRILELAILKFSDFPVTYMGEHWDPTAIQWVLICQELVYVWRTWCIWKVLLVRFANFFLRPVLDIKYNFFNRATLFHVILEALNELRQLAFTDCQNKWGRGCPEEMREWGRIENRRLHKQIVKNCTPEDRS